jgi:ribokinase
MYGAVGADAFAAAALANLVAAGVDLGGVATVDASTGVALINVEDSGENAITVIPGANAQARADAIPDARLAPGVTLLMQLELPVAEVASLAARAHRRGASVVLNAAPAVALPDAMLSAIDVLVVNQSEAAAYASAWRLPAAPAAFISAVAERFGMATVITLGSRGAMASLAGVPVNVAPPGVPVVDTTGAGDAFVGALAAALDRGAGIDAALAAGVTAGALACTHAGAQRWPAHGALYC